MEKRVISSVLALTLAACSTVNNGKSGDGADAATATGAATLDGCSSYVDHTTDAEVTLTWGFEITSQADHCSKIKAGSKVKWTGDFTAHPLNAAGGDMPNPITSSGTTGMGSVEITFPNAGTFGYECQVHSFMVGAIEVVP